MPKSDSNIIMMVIRGDLTSDEREWVLSSKEVEPDEFADVVDYAIGWESADSECKHDHVHILIRISRRISDDIKKLREIWNLDYFTNIQDITLCDNWDIPVRYVCKRGNYEWPSQIIQYPYSIPNPQWNYMQKSVLDELSKQDHRKILCVVEKRGNVGKSFLANWFERRFKATMLTVNRDYRDVLREAYCLHVKSHMNMDTVFVDIPRAFPQNELRFLYAAIETLKDGRITDDRYENRLRYIDSPKLCIFTNTDAPLDALTPDRWTIMVVYDENHLDIMDYYSYSNYLNMIEDHSKNAERQRRHRQKLQKMKKNEKNEQNHNQENEN